MLSCSLWEFLKKLQKFCSLFNSARNGCWHTCYRMLTKCQPSSEMLSAVNVTSKLTCMAFTSLHLQAHPSMKNYLGGSGSAQKYTARHVTVPVTAQWRSCSRHCTYMWKSCPKGFIECQCAAKALCSLSPTSMIEHMGHPLPSQQHRSELSPPSTLQAWDIYGEWRGWGGKQTLNLEPCSKDAGFLGACPDTKVQVSAR